MWVIKTCDNSELYRITVLKILAIPRLAEVYIWTKDLDTHSVRVIIKRTTIRSCF